jgi:hypothetical protein
MAKLPIRTILRSLRTMSCADEGNQQEGAFGDNEPEVDAELLAIHSALSNPDCLLLFDLASRGLRAGSSAIQSHNFSKKRFYVRLKELVDLGLVRKEYGVYKLTALGQKVYQSQVKDMRDLLERQQRLPPEKLQVV